MNAPRFLSGRPPGSALVIVLAFIVLIAIVMLSYLASTQSSLKKSSASAALVQTDLLAEAATAAIIDDIRQEMLAGADGTALPATNAPMSVTNGWAMVAGRVLSPGIVRTDTNFVNLVKQSVRTNAFYPGDSPAVYTAKGGGVGATGRTRASAVGTSEPSANGRTVSIERWNKPALLGGAGFSATNQLPDWILITRDGPVTDGASLGNYTNKTLTNANYVIGRFAYNIYNVGGLLDINVAGYPSNAQNEAATKGSMAWADLTAIPGISSPGAAQAFVSWRNKLTSDSPENYADLVRKWGEPRGFQMPYSASGSQENRFFGRQDLIKYAQTYGSGAIGTNALPYLTTFSADLDRPSFAPDPNRPKVLRSSAAGGNDAYGLDDALNPSFATLAGTNGVPLVKRRFPLDRLKIVDPLNAGDAAAAAKISAQFGLTWSAADKAWIYSADGVGNKIARLSQISGRDPNFVELMLAAVSVGSLGGQYQLDDEVTSPRQLGARDGSVSYHIMKIVANIIDQYDSDSYPTRIKFDNTMFYGTEDLPYLHSVRAIGYRQKLLGSADMTVSPAPSPGAGQLSTPYRCAIMVQPAVWNPHQPSSATSGPTQFRITAKGTSVSVRSNVGTTAYLPAWPGVTDTGGSVWRQNFPGKVPEDTSNVPVNFNPSSDYITFQTGTDASAPSAFRGPRTLKSPNYPPGSQSAGTTQVSTIGPSELNDPARPEESSDQAIGFRIGWVWGGPARVNSTTPSAYGFFDRALTYGDIDFELQYRTADGDYVTYDELPSVPPFESIYINQVLEPNRRPRVWARTDPRTDRFGPRVYLVMTGSTGSGASVQYHPEGTTYRPRSDEGREGFGDSATSAAVQWTRGARPEAWMAISENKETSSTRYNDPDGVRRVAMGGFSSGTIGLPMATDNFSSRPVILNRPFRSVAELGYVFRGTPWKQLDFWTPESGDAALLDVFCVSEPADADAEPLVAGRVNLNTRQPLVLQALLRGTSKATGNSLTDSEAASIADALVAWTSSLQPGKGPLRNRAELVGKFDASASSKFSGFSTELLGLLSANGGRIQMQRQSVMRALADPGTCRTWTFLIDLIVQKGRYPENSSGLDRFMVDGEERYWIHLAMDRLTGKILAEKVEVVND